MIEQAVQTLYPVAGVKCAQAAILGILLSLFVEGL